MPTTILALSLSIGLLAAPAAAPAPSIPLNASGTSRDFDKPPPGTPADQALWQSAHDMNNELVIEQHVAARLTYRAKANLGRLRDPAGRGTLTDARAEELAKPLVAKWNANVELMGAVWPVSKIRVCGNELVNLEGVMFAADTPAKAGQLADSRRDLNVCVDKATNVLKQLRKANEELDAANTEAERALGPPQPEKATPTAPAALAPKP